MARPVFLCKRDMSPKRWSRTHRNDRLASDEAWSGSGTPLVLDDLDAAILRELVLGDRGFFRSDRRSLETMARDLGVHRNTVAFRVRRMTKAGVFLPLSITVEPSQFGLLRGTLWVIPSTERRSELALASLWLVEGVQLVVQYVEGWIVFLYAEDEATLEARRNLVVHLLDASRSEWESLSGRDYPVRPPVHVRSLDIVLIRRLLADARSPFGIVARESGTSLRSVQRRFRELSSSGAIMVLPSGLGHATGLVLGHLRIWCHGGPEIKEQIRVAVDALLPMAVFRNLNHPRFASWVIAVPTLADVERLAARVRKVPSIDRVGLRVLLSFRLSPHWPGWLLRWLERAGGVAPRATGTAAFRLPIASPLSAGGVRSSTGRGRPSAASRRRRKA